MCVKVKTVYGKSFIHQAVHTDEDDLDCSTVLVSKLNFSYSFKTFPRCITLTLVLVLSTKFPFACFVSIPLVCFCSDYAKF